MAGIPRDRMPESTLPFLLDPYRFIGTRARRLRSDVFRTRLLGQRTVCMYGREAGQLFYDTTRMQRAGAMPGRVLKTLLGRGGVQGLDGEAHRLRKALFLDLVEAGRPRLLALAERQWQAHARGWQQAGRVCLYPAAAEVLAHAAFEWVGLPLQPARDARRVRDVVALFDGAGAVGPRHWKARLARRRCEAWLAEVVERIRLGSAEVDPASALARIAHHVDHDGQPLPARIAAVELLNLVRPVTAVCVYVTFVAHALHRCPAARAPVADGDAEALDRFVDEVRRYYPFFPAVAARTCRDIAWRGFELPAGTRVMFDLYGTCHDPRLWEAPERFDPQRFLAAHDGTFGLVPQGGGEHAHGHRCPGEWITRDLMAQAATQLVRRLDHTVAGDPDIDFRRVPALPAGGMVLQDVRVRD